MNNINFLAISDIHDNLRAVRKLRALEKNTFDAVIVAGDMGNKKDDDIMNILSSFECPILFVYGNWDNTQSYDKKFSQNCIHLHQKIVFINGYSFTGFSGCQASWGENPIAKEIISKTELKYEEYTKMISEIRSNAYKESAPIRETHSLACKKYLDLINTKNKQAKAYKKELEKISEEKTRQLKKIYHELDKILKSKAYNKYLKDLFKAYKDSEIANRLELFRILKNENCDFSKTFLITHDRLFKTHTEAPNLFCHIFGHRHGFKHTIFKGTQFINVSALDTDCEATYCKISVIDSEMKISCLSLR